MKREDYLNEYLYGVLNAPLVSQVSSSPTDGVRWECSYCSRVGQPRDTESKAERNGWQHTIAHHTTPEQWADAGAYYRESING